MRGREVFPAYAGMELPQPTLNWPVLIGSAELRVGYAKTLFQEQEKESVKQTNARSLQFFRFLELDPVNIELSTDRAGVYTAH